MEFFINIEIIGRRTGIILKCERGDASFRFSDKALPRHNVVKAGDQ